MLRAAILPCTVDVGQWPDLTASTDESVQLWRSWLRQVWSIDEFAAAVEVASPVLARRVHKVCEGTELRPRETHRAVVSTTRYLLRAAGRATPFGLFSGVAPATFDHAASARWDTQHRAVARVDAQWLDGLLARLESHPELRPRLLVVANSMAFVRDDRLVLGWHRRRGASASTHPEETSVRHTRPVQVIMQSAATPIRLRDLAEKMAADFTHAPTAVLDAMLATLVEQGFLITQLRPPMTATDPLSHVVEALEAVHAHTVVGVTELVDQIQTVHTGMTSHNDTASPTLAGALRTDLSRAMAALSPTEQPTLGVDLRLDSDVVLPEAVAKEAEAAATALVRLAPHPHGTPEWRDYHGRFLERYGPGAMVPVAELVADTGLGFPAGYRDSPWKTAGTAGLTERDATLMDLAQRAVFDQRHEIVLDEDTISRLEVTEQAGESVQPHTELRVRVQAPTQTALDRGEFQLVVAGVSRAAGTTTGRFLDLLDGDDQKRMATAYAGLPTVCDPALPVQMSGPALHPRTENVTRSPEILGHRVPLGEHHESRDDVLALNDLAVTADTERLYVVSRSRQCPVEPVVFSAVEMVNHAHPLLRFLCEISTARAVPCAPFSWGAANRLPFLPRVRHRKTILAPARWILTDTDLPDTAAIWHDWVASFHAWRRRFRVPETVYLGDADRRMRLDLHIPAHLYVLRTELERTGHVALREAPEDSAFGWLDGHAHEVVIPLAANTAGVPVPKQPTHELDRTHGHLPSGEWLYVKLYGHPERHNTMLANHLPELLAMLETEPEWWFLRYHDPDPHVRLRIHLRDREHVARTAINTWARRLRERGLVSRVQLDTYFPETGRFGAGSAMEAAESVFAADSAAVIAQLQAVDHRESVSSQALTAASMVNLVCDFTGDPGAGMRWLLQNAHTPSAPALDRNLREQALLLVDPHSDWSAVRALAGEEDIAAAWGRRRAALENYRVTLASTGEHEPTRILPDLLHLHHVRMAGVALEAERICLRLARAAALSWTTRIQGAL